MLSKKSKMSKVSKEQAILDAASELFLQRGFKIASIGEIMQQAACSRENIYRYFSSKEDIFANIIVLGVRKKLSQAQMKKLAVEVIDDFLLGYAQPS